jgi:sigma-B regulation protein RsbU (phosphoserine phosphatase)
MGEKRQIDAATTMASSFGCVELWAGNDLTHRHVELVGLEGDVLSLPSGAREGGDLYALFSCGGEQATRVVLADCVGHGYEASRIAAYIHGVIHQHRDIRDNSRLLSALNDEFTLPGQVPDAPLRLSTVITATFDRQTGEFNFAYAAHPRMLFWRARYRRWVALGEGLEGLPVGAFAGSLYSQQSIRIEPGDMVLMFSDGATDVFSPDDEMLTAEGFLKLASTTLEKFPSDFPLHLFVEALVEAIRVFHGKDDLEDDLTLLTLRRPLFTSMSLGGCTVSEGHNR